MSKRPTKKSTTPVPLKRQRVSHGPGLAPNDAEPFDYDATKPTPDEMTRWARPAVQPELLQQIDSKKSLTFQLVQCKSAYVRPDECTYSRRFIQWPGKAQVPVIHMYGATEEGHSVCVNVWNFAPYMYIHCPEGSAMMSEEDLEILANELDAKILAQKRKRKNEDDMLANVDEPTEVKPSKKQPWWLSQAVQGGQDVFAAELMASDRSRPLSKSNSRLSSRSFHSANNDSLRASTPMARTPAPPVRQAIVMLEYLERVVAKDYTDERTPLLRVHLRTPNLVPTLREMVGHRRDSEGVSTTFGTIRGPTYESGVRFETRFMVDHGLVGTGLVTVTGPYVTRRPSSNVQDSACQIELDVDQLEVKGISVEKHPERYLAPSRLRVHSRDIEVRSLTGDFPVAEQDPVIIIHSMVAEMETIDRPFLSVGFVLGSLPTATRSSNTQERFICFNNEADLLQAWGDYVRLIDPDIETGYNTKNFDAPYLFDRCTTLHVTNYLYSTRLKNKPIEKREKMRQSKNQGNRKSWLCPSEGRVEVDMCQFIIDNHKLSSYSLNAVSYEFLKDQKDDVSHKIIPILFCGSRDDRMRLARYCAKDTILPLRLMGHLRTMSFLCEMSRAQGVQLEDQQDGMATLKVFTMILTETRLCQMVIPYLPNQEKTWYQGASVFPPHKGFYQKPIVILDFFSLYPSEAIGHNLCFTTFVPKDRIATVAAALGGMDKLETCPEGNTYVRSNVKRGIVPRVQMRLMERREVAKAEMKKATDVNVKNAYSAREVALKVANNSVYGWTGIPNNGMYNQHVSLSITAYGRDQILKTRDVIESEFTVARGYAGNAKVLYGDTDSVMVDFGMQDILSWDDQDAVVYAVEKAQEYAALAATLCTKHFAPPNKLQIEGVIMPFLLITKKRYGGLLWPTPYQWSSMKIKGLECVRRDNCRHASRTQKQCLQLLFEKLDPTAAMELARQAIIKLRKNQVDFYDLIITANLSKKSEDYKTSQAHAHVADLIAQRSPGLEPHIGDRIPYVIVRGDKGAKRFERAEDPTYAIQNHLNLDTDYYVEKQMMGPLQRIFEPIFGEAETRRQLTTGDTNMRITRIDKLNTGLACFFERQENCYACGVMLANGSSTSRGLLCADCKPMRLDQLMMCHQELQTSQLEKARIWSHCQNCQGSLFREIVCDANDCPLFYKRMTILNEVDSLTQQVKKLSLEW